MTCTNIDIKLIAKDQRVKSDILRKDKRTNMNYIHNNINIKPFD